MSKINQRENYATKLVKNPQDKFKTLFEATPVALVEGLWGKTFDVVAVNPAALALFAAQTPAEFSTGFGPLLGKLPRKVLLELLSARLKGDLFEAEFRLPTLRRNFIYVFMRLAYIQGASLGSQHVVLAFHDVTHRRRQETFLKKLSQIDGLTKLLNQRTIMGRLDEEVSRARRYQVDLSCIIFDLDNFKKVNDTFGHLWGDKCIKRAAQALKDGFRKTDIIGRYGGDEFLAILPETRPDQAIIPIERFIKSYADNKASMTRKGKTIKTSFSIGICGFPADGIESGKDLIKAADQALYLSKTAGGNSFNIYGVKAG